MNSVMSNARACLLALQQELDSVDQSTPMILAIQARVDALQAMFGTEERPNRDFASATKSDLANLGIGQHKLRFNPTELGQLVAEKRAASEQQILYLCARISRIYCYVDILQSSARMILDAILLTVAEICANGDSKLAVAILPGMRIASEEGILLKNPAASFEILFSGAVDYGVCMYEDESERDFVLNAGLEDAGQSAKSRIFLVERGRLENKTLYDFIPEAISQAAALCEVTRAMAVKFCLTDGRKWIFSVLVTHPSGQRVCYTASALTILEPRLDPEGRDAPWERSIHQIVELVHHWLVADGDPLLDVLYQTQD
ncbi:hypothetical protein DFH06DRAFT_1224789 [Mycena polygramma]|nr:hypothetical protein DFH06DRAFT_1224789 [Mycena polygramma]